MSVCVSSEMCACVSACVLSEVCVCVRVADCPHTLPARPPASLAPWLGLGQLYPWPFPPASPPRRGRAVQALEWPTSGPAPRTGLSAAPIRTPCTPRLCPEAARLSPRPSRPGLSPILSLTQQPRGGP